MAHRSSALIDRISRLENRIVPFPTKPMTKNQRDAMVRRFSTEADVAAILYGEADPNRRAAIEAAMRADL